MKPTSGANLCAYMSIPRRANPPLVTQHPRASYTYDKQRSSNDDDDDDFGSSHRCRSLNEVQLCNSIHKSCSRFYSVSN